MRLFSGLSPQKKEAFGLDIGSSAIKLVQLGNRPGGYQLQAHAVVPLPPEVISEGLIRDRATAVQAVRQAVSKAGITGNNAVIAVSGRELIVKRLQLPKVPAKELDGAIRLEAEHHIPFAIDDVYLDYQILRKAPGSNGTMDVVLVAVKKTKVDDYVALAGAAGLNPVVVDVDSFALENQFELNYPELAGETVALIDIGASVMKINVVRGGASIFVRDIAFGGNNFTQAIAKRLKVPFEQAEAVKRGEGGNVQWDDVVPALEAVSRELALEIQRTLDYFASTTEPERIHQILLSGGCARLAGLDEYLSSSWGIPLEIANPLKGIELDPERFRHEDHLETGPMLAVAVGLAIRHPGDGPK